MSQRCIYNTQAAVSIIYSGLMLWYLVWNCRTYPGDQTWFLDTQWLATYTNVYKAGQTFQGILGILSAFITIIALVMVFRISKELKEPIQKKPLVLHGSLVLVSSFTNFATLICYYITPYYTTIPKSFAIIKILAILTELFTQVIITYICWTMGSAKGLANFRCTIVVTNGGCRLQYTRLDET
jgi:hypothetical protein